jgi:putative FmdB family regulatory protein
MPLYEYECESCGKRFEKIQKFSDPLVDVCPDCGKGPVKKLLSSPAIQFKGSGWYITDYPKGGGKDTKGSKDSKEKDTKEKDTKETKDTKDTKETTSTTTETKPAASDKKD